MMKILFALLWCNTFLQTLQQMTCPSNAKNMTICSEEGSSEVWVSRLGEGEGSRQGGEAFQVKWNPDPDSDNYVISLLEVGSMMSIRSISTPSFEGFTIRDLVPNTFYDAMVCRPGTVIQDFRVLTVDCGFCRYCFRTGGMQEPPTNGATPGGLSSGALVGIIVAVVVVAVLAMLGCVLFLALCCYKRRLLLKQQMDISRPTYNPNSRLADQLSNSTDQLNTAADMQSSLEGNRDAIEMETSLTHPTLLQNLPISLIIDPSNIEVGNIIGQGEFGLVYKGQMISKGGEEVAIKTLKGIFTTTSDVESLSEEINKMIQFDHPNVMSLIGVCMVPSAGASKGSEPCMVMPFMDRGSLLDQLRAHSEEMTVTDEDSKVVVVVRKDLNQMCLQIAKGMEYLATLRFVHRDLAARNCLVDMKGVIKVSDFGLAEDIYSQNYFKQASGGTKLPLKWMSIESITQGRFTEKTDVWSYGVTCWEIFTGGNIPYPGIHPREVLEYLESGHRLKKPKNAACEPNIFSMMESCWEHKDSSRPTFSDIVSILERHLEFTADYLDLSGAPASQGETGETGTSQATEEYGSLPRIPAAPNAYYKS